MCFQAKFSRILFEISFSITIFDANPTVGSSANGAWVMESVTSSAELFKKLTVPQVVTKARYRFSGIGEGEGGDTSASISPAGEGEGGDSESRRED
jgi:hypothetical protein